MSNNAPDYEDNLVFPPQEIKSQDDLNQPEKHSTEVLVTAIEKCKKLEKQLKIAIWALKSILQGEKIVKEKDGSEELIETYALGKIKELDK